MSHTGAMAEADLDIVIPVYKEGANIVSVLRSFAAHVTLHFRVLIGYDQDDDDTLEAIRVEPVPGITVVPVKNRGQGAFGAVVTCLAHSRAAAVLVYPADDDYNAPRIDGMIAKIRDGADVVCASRFMPGGRMTGCPLVKRVILRSSAFALHHLARLPTHDPSNGLRMFSRRLLDRIPIESSEGFTYSIELLVKAHRLGWRIDEVPAEWHERVRGKSRFRVMRWLPAYFRWFRYAFATSYLRRGPETVPTSGDRGLGPAQIPR